LLLSDLTPPIIAEARDALLSGKTSRGNIRSPSTVNRHLAAFSKALTIAVKEWGWLDDTPMRKVTKPAEGKGRNRLLSLEEKDRFLKACKESSSPHLFKIVSLALLTGMRQGEILTLTFESCDFQKKLITLEQTKNGERRILPMTGAVEKILSSCKKSDIESGLIFKPSKRKNSSRLVDVYYAFQKALKKAKIKDFRFHDLRHAAASYLAMNGATQGELMTILGHKFPAMTCRYVHYNQNHMADLMERMHSNLKGNF
jgi:integrase